MLNDYYVNKFCSPTRTSLMTGRWSYNIGTSAGIIDNGHPANMPLSESTVAESLAELGYRNYALGKWDCGVSAAPAARPTLPIPAHAAVLCVCR